MKKLQEKVIITVSIDKLSGCYYMGSGRWEIEPSSEDLLLHGSEYDRPLDACGSDCDDPEHLHEEDFYTKELSFNLVYREEDLGEYGSYVDAFTQNRDSFYGYAGGNTKEFRSMYGDGEPLTLAEWLIYNADPVIL